MADRSPIRCLGLPSTTRTASYQIRSSGQRFSPRNWQSSKLSPLLQSSNVREERAPEEPFLSSDEESDSPESRGDSIESPRLGVVPIMISSEDEDENLYHTCDNSGSSESAANNNEPEKEETATAAYSNVTSRKPVDEYVSRVVLGEKNVAPPTNAPSTKSILELHRGGHYLVPAELEKTLKTLRLTSVPAERAFNGARYANIHCHELSPHQAEKYSGHPFLGVNLTPTLPTTSPPTARLTGRRPLPRARSGMMMNRGLCWGTSAPGVPTEFTWITLVS